MKVQIPSLPTNSLGSIKMEMKRVKKTGSKTSPVGKNKAAGIKVGKGAMPVMKAGSGKMKQQAC